MNSKVAILTNQKEPPPAEPDWQQIEQNTASLYEIADALKLDYDAVRRRAKRGRWITRQYPSRKHQGKVAARVLLQPLKESDPSLYRTIMRMRLRKQREAEGLKAHHGGLVLREDDGRLALTTEERLLIQGLFLRGSPTVRKSLQRQYPSLAGLLNVTERPDVAHVFDLLKSKCVRCGSGPLVPKSGEHYQGHRYGRWQCTNRECGFALCYQTVRRIYGKIPAAERTLAREGINAFRNKYGCYIQRDWREYGRSEYINGDHHECDIRLWDPEHPKTDSGEALIFSPWISAWQDLKTCVVSYRDGGIGNPNADLLGLAFRDYVLEWGKPEAVLTDNGKDYRSQQFERLCERELHVEMRNTLPSKRAGESHAKSKPIERFFGTLERDFVKHQPGWRGSHEKERPPELWVMEQQHKAFIKGERSDTPLITVQNFRQRMRNWVNESFFKVPVKGLDMSPRDGYNSDTFPIQKVSERVMDVLLWRPDSRQVGRNGVRVQNFTYWHPEFFHLKGEPCEVRIDPADYSRAIVRIDSQDLPIGYRVDGELWPRGKDRVIIAYNEPLLGKDATKEDVAEAMRRQRDEQRAIRKSAETKALRSLGVSTLDQVLADKASKSEPAALAVNGIPAVGLPGIRSGYEMAKVLDQHSANKRGNRVQKLATPHTRCSSEVARTALEMEGEQSPFSSQTTTPLRVMSENMETEIERDSELSSAEARPLRLAPEPQPEPEAVPPIFSTAWEKRQWEEEHGIFPDDQSGEEEDVPELTTD